MIILLLGVICLQLTSSFSFPESCTDACVGKMQMVINSMPDEKRVPLQQMPWSTFLNTPGNQEIMVKFFSKICESYDRVDQCLKSCDERSRQMTIVRQTYAGLKYICRDNKSAFFAALPCLAEYEPIAMVKCNKEINQSHTTTTQFTESVVNREFHSIQAKFKTLCRDVSGMIKCMEPVIRSGCGAPSTNLLLNFIRLEFASFEQLYSQLGLDEPLPSQCRLLLVVPERRRNKPSQPHTFITRYPSRASRRYTSLIYLIWVFGVLLTLHVN